MTTFGVNGKICNKGKSLYPGNRGLWVQFFLSEMNDDIPESRINGGWCKLLR